MAVGIIAAQSIGEPGTQLTMRTFHIGGVGHPRRRGEGRQGQERRAWSSTSASTSSSTTRGRTIALARNGEILILDAKGRELEKYDVPDGAELMVEDGQQVTRGTMLCEWDPHIIPILAEVGGKVRFEDIVEGETMRIENDPARPHPPDDHGAQGRPAPADRHRRRRGQDPRRLLHPRAGAASKSTKGQKITRRHPAGQDAARGRRHAGHHRRPAARHRALRGPQAQGPGRHRRDRRPRRAARREAPRQADDHRQERERHRDASTSSRTASTSASTPATTSEAGDPLVDGPLVPHDILRISRRGGRAAVPAPRDPERLPLPARGDRRQAHRDHRRPDAPQGAGRDVGDTGLLPGSVIDKFEFRGKQPGADELRQDQGPGRHRLPPGRHRPQDALRAGEPPGRGGRRQDRPSGIRPKPAAASTQLLGITKAAVQSRQLHLGRQLPGDDQGAHRGGPGRQGRLPGRPEGERDPRPPDPGRHRLQAAPGGRGPHPPRGPRGPRREGPRLQPLPPRRGRRPRRQGRASKPAAIARHRVRNRRPATSHAGCGGPSAFRPVALSIGVPHPWPPSPPGSAPPTTAGP